MQRHDRATVRMQAERHLERQRRNLRRRFTAGTRHDGGRWLAWALERGAHVGRSCDCSWCQRGRTVHHRRLRDRDAADAA